MERKIDYERWRLQHRPDEPARAAGYGDENVIGAYPFLCGSPDLTPLVGLGRDNRRSGWLKRSNDSKRPFTTGLVQSTAVLEFQVLRPRKCVGSSEGKHYSLGKWPVLR